MLDAKRLNDGSLSEYRIFRILWTQPHGNAGCITACIKASTKNPIMRSLLNILTFRVMSLEMLLFFGLIPIFAIHITFFVYALHKMTVEILPASNLEQTCPEYCTLF